MLAPTVTTTILLSRGLEYRYFIGSDVSTALSAPILVVNLQYFDVDGYVEAGYTVL
jgi:hypothetical protein